MRLLCCTCNTKVQYKEAVNCLAESAVRYTESAVRYTESAERYTVPNFILQVQLLTKISSCSLIVCIDIKAPDVMVA